MTALGLATHLVVLLLVPPLLLGLIVRIKALAAGRQGPPVLQQYFDLFKLLRKGAVYSRTTTAVFRAGPIIGLASVIVAGLIVPLGRGPAPLHFQGDLVAFAYLLGLGRFATVLAALDTGSSFEGMGASREATFSALAEPTLFLGLALYAIGGESLSLTDIAATIGPGKLGPALLLITAGLLVVTLVESSRVPIDDPATHLELTMVHEVMVLDHGGPDLAMILYGAALKFVVVGSLVVLPFLPGPFATVPDVVVFVLAMAALAVGIGLIESVMARLRLARVSLLILGAFVVSVLGVVITIAGRPA